MAFITWHDSLATGHVKIDAQHKVLVDLINSLFTAKQSDSEQSEVLRIFMQLYRYTSYHFDTEEALMSGMKYGFEPAHKLEHKKFVRQLDSLSEKAKSGDAHITMDTMTWLVDWLLDHIAVTDKMLVKCLQNN